MAWAGSARGETPITPNASREAQALAAFLQDTYGKHILSGQQEGWRGTNELGFELNYIREASGKLPALLAMDLAPYTGRSPSRRAARHEVVDHAIDWYRTRNGIVSLCWHWSAPMNERAFYTKETRFRPSRAVIDGTPEYAATLRDIDLIADELKLLCNAHVPVLWRPLHEANGRWFWWGADGPEPFKKLWQLIFQRLTGKHKLNNLLWVFSPGAGIDLADWYPGDAYVDIVAPDHYPMDGDPGPAKDIFQEMVALTGGAKPVGFGENGPIPDPELLFTKKAGWLFFTAWSGKTLTDWNSPEHVRKSYNHAYVLTLEALPDLKQYPFSRVGKAKKLAFAGTVPGFAIGSPARLPLVVAIQDEQGQTVREGNHVVTLRLAETGSGEATLTGTTCATTVNGLATFPDLVISRGGSELRFQAEAKGLVGATSPPFEPGPGTGILREIMSDLHERKTSILGKGFETPVLLATNFTARYRGCLVAPITGDYVFRIANEGTSELWLSTNATPDQKVKIVEVSAATPYSKWPHTHEAKSNLIRLEAGRRYYIEASQRQRAGSTHFCVSWTLPNGTEERPIPGQRLISWDPATH